jgi:hypothetical protein
MVILPGLFVIQPPVHSQKKKSPVLAHPSLILGLIKHSIPARLHDPTDSVDYVDMVSA